MLLRDRAARESENVVEGVPGKFSLNLKPGKYVVNCPNGQSENQGRLVATGSGEAAAHASGASAALLEKATAGYRWYVIAQAAALRADTARFVAALRSGQLARAKALFGPTRLHYESIEPVAESFGNLDPRIDARINDVTYVTNWTGFHRIEQILWQRGTTHGMAPAHRPVGTSRTTSRARRPPSGSDYALARAMQSRRGRRAVSRAQSEPLNA